MFFWTCSYARQRAKTSFVPHIHAADNTSSNFFREVYAEILQSAIQRQSCSPHAIRQEFFDNFASAPKGLARNHFITCDPNEPADKDMCQGAKDLIAQNPEACIIFVTGTVQCKHNVKDYIQTLDAKACSRVFVLDKPANVRDLAKCVETYCHSMQQQERAQFSCVF